MAFTDFISAFPWAQLGRFQVGLCLGSDLESPTASLVAILTEVQGGAR